MKKIAFVREFTVKENAEKFAEKKNGKVEKKYRWDYLKDRLVKKFVVKYWKEAPEMGLFNLIELLVLTRAGTIRQNN